MKKKNIYIFSFAIIVVIILTLAPYFTKFHSGLSDNQDVFANFGSYVGGVLSPVFSFFTILILIYTLQIQREELKKSKDESKKKDVIEILKNIDLNLKEFLEIYHSDEEFTKFENNARFNDASINKFKLNLLILLKFLEELYALDYKSPLLYYYHEKYQAAVISINNGSFKGGSYDLKKLVKFFYDLNKELSIGMSNKV